MKMRELIGVARDTWGVCVMIVLVVAALFVMIVDVLDGGKLIMGPVCLVVAAVFGGLFPFLQIVIEDIKEKKVQKR